MVAFGEGDGGIVAGVGVADDAEAGVGGEDAFEAAVHFGGAIGDHDHAGVLRVADADATAIVDADPGCAGSGIDEGIEEGPIGNGVAAIEHALDFAEGGGDGAGIEVVAADDDGGLQFAVADKAVDGKTEFGAFAIAEPADARGEALELDVAAGKREPAGEGFIVGEKFEGEPIGAEIGRASCRERV